MDINNQDRDLKPYAGRWVALIRNQVVGQGGTPEQAINSAQNIRYKETPQVKFVSPFTPFKFHPLINTIQQVIPPDYQVYIVGGAIRDALLGIAIKDVDFVVNGDVFKVARIVADHFNGSFFPLDTMRMTGRVTFSLEVGVHIVLDFAKMRGGDLNQDLHNRDFTINAMASDLHKPEEILDPLGGARDLLDRNLRECSPSSFIDDPVRILRAVRIAVDYSLRILPETKELMRSSVSSLLGVTKERIRDEIIKILQGKNPKVSLQALDRISALEIILPEIAMMKGVQQSYPHKKDVWQHALDTLGELEKIIHVLQPNHDPTISSNLFLGLSVVRLRKFTRFIKKHLETSLVEDRSFQSLLFFAALYHDVGKISPMDIKEDSSIHAEIGGKKIRERAAGLKFSNSEIARLGRIIDNHMVPAKMARNKNDISSKTIYRFFRKTQSAGVDICILSLADLLASYGTEISQDRWLRQLDVVYDCLDAWWEKPELFVNPPKIISGGDLIKKFGLKPGSQIGSLLEQVREAQVMGEVSTSEDAIKFVESIVKNR